MRFAVVGYVGFVKFASLIETAKVLRIGNDSASIERGVFIAVLDADHLFGC